MLRFVMLVLLVIFMVTAPLLMEGVQVDLPDVDAERGVVQLTCGGRPGGAVA